MTPAAAGCVSSKRRRIAGRRDRLPEPAALGAEFMRWEIATAIAGALLQDQSVRRAERQAGEGRDHDAAGAVHQPQGALPRAAPDLTLEGGVTLTPTTKPRERAGRRRTATRC